jgi:inosine/xanthosine triphosphate pyrophosphatase family protein
MYNPIDRQVTLISSRQRKGDEFSVIMPDFTVHRTHFEALPTLENLKTKDLPMLAAYRVFLAWKKIKEPVIIEETSLDVFLDEDTKFVGPYYPEIVEQQFGRKKFAQNFDGKKAVASNAVAYTRDGINIYVTTGELRGTVRWFGEDRWKEDACGWNAFLVPEGFMDVTLGDLWLRELATVNFRHLPVRELYARCMADDGMSFEGVYETHITVANVDTTTDDGKDAEHPSSDLCNKFKSICQELGLRPLIITEHSRTEMQTAKYQCFKTREDAERSMRKTGEILAQRGFIIVRQRLEAMAYNKDVPVSNFEASQRPEQHYFEFHARIGSLAENAEPPEIEGCCYSKVKGRWFVTMRFYCGDMDSLGRDAALSEWGKQVKAIESFIGRPLEKLVKPEFCIFDDNPEYPFDTIS